MRVAFVTNFCPHYRVGTFETLARYIEVDYYFYSAGREWYWQRAHGTRGGAFRYRYLPGLELGGTRLTPTLPWHLIRGDYDAYIVGLVGRFALPVATLASRTRRRPLILWSGIWSRLGSPFHRATWPLTRALYGYADAIVGYGEHVRRYLRHEGLDPDRLFVAPHAIDNASYRDPLPPDERAALRAALGVGAEARVLLYLGRLEPSKGLGFLIDAFSRVERDGVVLVIAGDGSERGALISRARARGVAGRVRFPGYVPVERARHYYAIAYAGILPSITTAAGREPWGLVVNEAFNQGVPMICTDAVGAAAGGLVRDGETGLVVPEREVGSLAAAIARLLDEPMLRERLGGRAAAEILTWDNEAMVAGFRRALDAAVARRATARA